METPSPTITRVGDMTLDELRHIIHVEIVRVQSTEKQPPIPKGNRPPLDLPVDDLGPWPEGLTFSREEMYGDDGR